jgi:hypothetical protein
MPNKYPRRHFFSLYFATIASFVIPNVLANEEVIPFSYGLPWEVWTFLIIIAVFFIVIAIPHRRKVLNSIETPAKYSPKHFLILLWLTAQAFVIGVILHNVFYALGIITSHITPLSQFMEVLEVVFFIIAIPIVPIGAVAGAVGRVWEWAVVKSIDEMKDRGIQLPNSWRYFAPIGSYVWLLRFGKGIEAITDKRIRAAGVFASVFFLGIIGFFIIRYAIHRRLEKA